MFYISWIWWSKSINKTQPNSIKCLIDQIWIQIKNFTTFIPKKPDNINVRNSGKNDSDNEINDKIGTIARKKLVFHEQGPQLR